MLSRCFPQRWHLRCREQSASEVPCAFGPLGYPSRLAGLLPESTAKVARVHAARPCISSLGFTAKHAVFLVGTTFGRFRRTFATTTRHDIDGFVADQDVRPSQDCSPTTPASRRRGSSKGTAGAHLDLRYFRMALKAYDRAELIRREDHSGKWKTKVTEYKARMRAGDPAYAPDNEHDALVDLLFPEVMAQTL